jgi:serine/threonine protein phosphatase 1
MSWNTLQIFVHAGVDENAGDLWSVATPDHVFTEKYPPTCDQFVKTVVAGHVATSKLHDDGSHGVYYDGESHYYIDGSVEAGGQVNILRYAIADGTCDFFVVDPSVRGDRWQSHTNGPLP